VAPARLTGCWPLAAAAAGFMLGEGTQGWHPLWLAGGLTAAAVSAWMLIVSHTMKGT
jgi:hypothetical protein